MDMTGEEEARKKDGLHKNRKGLTKKVDKVRMRVELDL